MNTSTAPTLEWPPAAPSRGGSRPQSYPGPGDPHARPALRRHQAAVQCGGRASRDRVSLGGRPGVVRRWPLSLVERHPEQPDHAVGRRNRRRQRLRKPSNHANGNTRDRQGRLVTCEHEGRRVTRTEYDGSITVILDRFDGKRLNSPNDVVVKSDGSIWFTDPPFGILGNYEGEQAPPGIADQCLSGRRQDRRRHGRDRRHQRAERPVLFARREQALHRRIARQAAADQRFRRGRGRRQARQSAASSSMPARDRPTASAAMSTAICGAAGA